MPNGPGQRTAPIVLHVEHHTGKGGYPFRLEVHNYSDPEYKPRYHVAAFDGDNQHIGGGSVDLHPEMKKAHFHPWVSDGKQRRGVGLAMYQLAHRVAMKHGLRLLPTSEPSGSALAVWEHIWDNPEKWDNLEKLARSDPQPTTGLGGAVAELGTEQLKKRIELIKQITTEAGLSPADVRQVLAHSGPRGMKAAVMTMIHKHVHPDRARYAAAWYGLLSGEKRLTVFHPHDSGPDRLHVIQANVPQDVMAGYLQRSGVPEFNLENVGAGGGGTVTRAYVYSPKNVYNLDHVAGGLNASHSTVGGFGYRIGAREGSDADSRATYRSVIRSYETSGESGPAADADTAPVKASRVHPAGLKVKLALAPDMQFAGKVNPGQLADHMQDHDDPREELVRADQKAEADRNMKCFKLADRNNVKLGFSMLPKGQGHISVITYYPKPSAIFDRSHLPMAHYVKWFAPTGVISPATARKLMSPEAFSEWLAKWEPEHAEKLRQAAEGKRG